jgi:hypothetical protein
VARDATPYQPDTKLEVLERHVVLYIVMRFGARVGRFSLSAIAHWRRIDQLALGN